MNSRGVSGVSTLRPVYPLPDPPPARGRGREGPPSSGPRGLGCGSDRRGARLLVVLDRDVLLRPLLDHRRGDERDYRRNQDVNGDGKAGLVAADVHSKEGRAAEQRRRNHGRRAAGDDRGELIAERRTTVAQPAGETLRDERRLRSVLHVVWDQGEKDGEEHQGRYLRVQQTEVDEAPDAHHRNAGHVHTLPSNPVRQIAKKRY